MCVSRQPLTSRHACWWLMDISPEQFDSEYLSCRLNSLKDDRAYRGRVESPSYTHVVNIPPVLVTLESLVLEEMRPSSRQPGPEASPSVRLPHGKQTS